MQVVFEERGENMLRANISTFAFSHEDMTRIPTDIDSHQLQIDPEFHPVKQPQQKLAKEKAEAANAEVQRLLECGFIREVKYPRWLSNVVLVKKKNNKW